MVTPIESIGGKHWRDLRGGESEFKALNMNKMRPQGLMFIPDPEVQPFELEILPVSWLNGTSLDDWAGIATFTLSPSETRSFWLDGSQPPATQLQSSAAGFPVLSATPIFLIGQVTTDGSGVIANGFKHVQRMFMPNVAGVNSVTANSPLVQSGPATDPVIDLPNATGGAAGAMSAADKTKLDAVPDPATILVDGDYANPGDILQGSDPGPGPTVLALGTPGQVLTVNGTGTAAEWAGAGITDPNAIHSNQVNEINSITEKVTPTTDDVILIEDDADSFNKKKVLLGNLPGIINNAVDAVDADGVDILDVIEDLQVSTPQNPQSASFGGRPYTAGMVVQTNDNLEAGTFADRTTEAASPTGSTFPGFPGTGVNNTLFIGADEPFNNIKVNTTVVAITAGNPLLWQYWDGSTWVTASVMVTSLWPSLASQVTDAFGRVATEHLRFDDGVVANQALKTINGFNKYWIRAVISPSPWTQVPTIESVRIVPSSVVIHPDGVVERFGSAQRSRREAFVGLDIANDPADFNIDYSTNILFVAKDNRFQDGQIDSLGRSFLLPEGLDTSKGLRVRIYYAQSNAGTGDLELRVRVVRAQAGSTLLNGGGTEFVFPEIETISVSAEDLLRLKTVTVDLQPWAADQILGMVVERDATGGNLNDTLSGDIYLVAVVLEYSLYTN